MPVTENAPEPANTEQLRLLISLHLQQGVAVDPRELARLTKWQASERINLMRGRPAASPDELDEALLEVLQHRAAVEGEPTLPDA
jgi:hypothetical protein